MKILELYIIKTVIVFTLLVLLVVTGLTYFISFLGELRDIGIGDYGVLQAALHVLLELPHAVYQLFPMLVLLGGLMGSGMLATHQELIVMRVSGMTTQQITRAVFYAAIILTLIGVFMGEVVSPRAHYVADQHKSAAESGGQAIATRAGVWIHEGTNFFHIDRVISRQYLEGVTRYEYDNQHRLLASYYAKVMNYQHGEWRLHDVVKTTFTRDATMHEEIAETTWHVALKPRFLNVGLNQPDEMPLPNLVEYTQHLVKNGLQASDYQFNFWKRIFQPLTTLIMLLLAIPFVFAAPRSMTMGLRLLLGIIVGFVFYILTALLGQLSIVFQMSPFLAALLPILLFAIIGYLLMLRVY